jgi:hypothetical protein
VLACTGRRFMHDHCQQSMKICCVGLSQVLRKRKIPHQVRSQEKVLDTGYGIVRPTMRCSSRSANALSVVSASNRFLRFSLCITCTKRITKSEELKNLRLIILILFYRIHKYTIRRSFNNSEISGDVYSFCFVFVPSFLNPLNE